MEIRKIELGDQAAYTRFEAAMLADKKENPYVEWWEVEDFAKFVADSDQSEIRNADQTWSTYTRYFAFIDGEMAGFVICFWDMTHPDCLKLGHVGYMIAPAFRRKGIASQLVDFSCARYREKGESSVIIATDQDNLASRQLIEKKGGHFLTAEVVEHMGQTLNSVRYQLNL